VHQCDYVHAHELVQGARVYNKDFILGGALQQAVNFDKYQIHVPQHEAAAGKPAQKPSRRGGRAK
jgi:hypothetical protein